MWIKYRKQSRYDDIDLSRHTSNNINDSIFYYSNNRLRVNWTWILHMNLWKTISVSFLHRKNDYINYICYLFFIYAKDTTKLYTYTLNNTKQNTDYCSFLSLYDRHSLLSQEDYAVNGFVYTFSPRTIVLSLRTMVWRRRRYFHWGRWLVKATSPLILSGVSVKMSWRCFKSFVIDSWLTMFFRKCYAAMRPSSIRPSSPKSEPFPRQDHSFSGSFQFDPSLLFPVPFFFFALSVALLRHWKSTAWNKHTSIPTPTIVATQFMSLPASTWRISLRSFVVVGLNCSRCSRLNCPRCWSELSGCRGWYEGCRGRSYSRRRCYSRRRLHTLRRHDSLSRCTAYKTFLANTTRAQTSVHATTLQRAIHGLT